MHHLDGRRKGQRLFHIAPTHAAELERQNRADALAAGKQTVAHCVEKLLLRRVVGEKRFQIVLHGFLVVCHYVFKHHRVHTPFLPVCRRRFSSA